MLLFLILKEDLIIRLKNYFTYEGIDEIHRDINNYKNKYKYTKIYEDKIYNKIKNFLKWYKQIIK